MYKKLENTNAQNLPSNHPESRLNLSAYTSESLYVHMYTRIYIHTYLYVISLPT